MNAACCTLATILLLAVCLDRASAQRDDAMPSSVPLRVNLAEGIDTPSAWPVTTGVPFKDGWLASPENLRLETAAGAPVPAQFQVRGTYPRSGDVRWLGVDFQLDPGAEEYRLALGAQPAPAHATPVRIDQTGDALVVSTGDLKAEIPKAGAMLRRVWLGEDLLIDQGESDGNWLTTLDGIRFSEQFDQDIRATVELEGPLHSVIRVDGRYVDAQGNPSCRWTARLHFFAGRPFIQVSHTFTWIGTAEDLKIKDLALSFGLSEAATQASADRAATVGDEHVARDLQPGTMLSLLQDQHWHWGHGESHFGVYAGPPDQPEEIETGERAGSWIAAGNGRQSVTLVLRDLWQQFPKELRATPSELTAYLWTSSGNADPFDLTYDGLETFWSDPIVEELYSPKWNETYQRYRENPSTNDPTGMSKTHDMLLIFGVGEGASASGAQIAEAFDDPPLVLPDPRWTYESDVVGRLWPVDTEQFPELEGWIDTVWSETFDALDEWGDYGFFSCGDGPHQAYLRFEGHPIATVWRYTTGVEYGVGKAGWLGYLRSGDRRFYEYASAHSRFLNDVMLCHEESASRWKGAWSWHAKVPIPWVAEGNGVPGPAGHARSFGFFIEHALYYYYLTGDERSMDVVREYAAALKRYIDSEPDWAENYVDVMWNSMSRWCFQRLDEFAVLYEQLGDPWFYERAQETADQIIDLDDSSGIHRDRRKQEDEQAPFPTYIFYKGPNFLSYLRNLSGDDLARAQQAFVKMCEHSLRTQNDDARSIGLRMAYAYYFSGDPKFLAFAARRMALRRDDYIMEPRGDRPYITRIQTATAYNALINGAYLMAALQECDEVPEWPPLLFKMQDSPPAEFVFIKDAGEPLTIELSANETTMSGPDGRALPEAWLGEAIAYCPHSDRIPDLLYETPLLYRTVSIPGDAPAGEYRIHIAEPGSAYVLSTNASRAVMVAPNGFYVGLVPDGPWHFRVPDGAAELRLFCTTRGSLILRDPEGAEVQLNPLDDREYRALVPPDAAGRMWSVTALLDTEVSFAGIHPVFAHRDPARYFLPAGVAQQADLPLIDTGGRSYKHGVKWNRAQ